MRRARTDELDQTERTVDPLYRRLWLLDRFSTKEAFLLSDWSIRSNGNVVWGVVALSSEGSLLGGGEEERGGEEGQSSGCRVIVENDERAHRLRRRVSEESHVVKDGCWRLG